MRPDTIKNPGNFLAQRSVFRTQSSIYNDFFLQNQLKAFSRELFLQKMFLIIDRVLNMLPKTRF